MELPSTENEYVSTSEADGGGEPKVVFKEKQSLVLELWQKEWPQSSKREELKMENLGI